MNISTERHDLGRSELVREAFHLTRRFDRLANKLPPTGDCVPAGKTGHARYSQTVNTSSERCTCGSGACPRFKRLGTAGTPGYRSSRASLAPTGECISVGGIRHARYSQTVNTSSERCTCGSGACPRFRRLGIAEKPCRQYRVQAPLPQLIVIRGNRYVTS